MPKQKEQQARGRKAQDLILMTANDYKETYEGATDTLSQINRNMALAGVAIIWMFTKTDSGVDIPKPLLWPAILLVSSLSLDVLQYVWKTMTFYILFRRREKNEKNEKKQQGHSIWLVRPIWGIFWLKIIAMGWAYVLIFMFFVSLL